MNNSFKIGDLIKPKEGFPQQAKVSSRLKTLGGTVVNFLSSGGREFPIIENQDGDLHTVNPDLYEIVESK